MNLTFSPPKKQTNKQKEWNDSRWSLWKTKPFNVHWEEENYVNSYKVRVANSPIITTLTSSWHPSHCYHHFLSCSWMKLFSTLKGISGQLLILLVTWLSWIVLASMNKTWEWPIVTIVLNATKIKLWKHCHYWLFPCQEGDVIHTTLRTKEGLGSTGMCFSRWCLWILANHIKRKFHGTCILIGLLERWLNSIHFQN